MNKAKLEYRMYGLVPYNLSPIQQGIQFGHAVVEYVLEYVLEKIINCEEIDKEVLETLYKWAKFDKTFMVYNGGTTNTQLNMLGTLNVHALTVGSMGVKRAQFHEPDLGNQLTAVVFLVDERVWDKEKYPDPPKLTGNEIFATKDNQPPYEYYQAFIDNMGGEHILEFRQFLSQFRFA